MTQAIVAVFNQHDRAKQALDALLSDGFSRERTQLSSAAESSEASSSTGGNGNQDESFGQTVAKMFGFGEDDEKYSDAVRSGNSILTVDVDNDDDARRAEGIMDGFNPVDIDERSAQLRHDAGAETRGGDGETVAVPIVEEEMQIGKRETSRGGVRVKSHNYQQDVDEDVNLHEQHTNVSSRSVDRAATDEDMAFGEVDFETRDTAEEAVVSKQARVVEEVVVGQEGSDQTKTVKDSVRRTEVDVENVDEEGEVKEAVS